MRDLAAMAKAMKASSGVRRVAVEHDSDKGYDCHRNGFLRDMYFDWPYHDASRLTSNHQAHHCQCCCYKHVQPNRRRHDHEVAPHDLFVRRLCSLVACVMYGYVESPVACTWRYPRWHQSDYSLKWLRWWFTFKIIRMQALMTAKGS